MPSETRSTTAATKAPGKSGADETPTGRRGTALATVSSSEDMSKTTSGSDLEIDAGKITVNDAVVTKIAGLAAREISGVHAMGVGSARALGALKQRIPGSASTVTAGQGVNVEVGETEAAIDLDVVIEYGVSIADLGRSIQRNVKESVERITGLTVVEVNVNIDDIYLGDDDEDDRPARVQ